jgi:aryl-phospho-beta-D-glucosidase BglC (GH1 family)
VQRLVLLTLGALLSLPLQAARLPNPSASHLPRWRGFNLLEKFIYRPKGNPPFQENDFRWISAWGFNFVRLPMDYRVWIKDGDWEKIDPKARAFRDIDQAVAWGRKYGIHLCLNFHRAPGYCINNKVKEPGDLWTDPHVQDICARHWTFFAHRYKGIPSRYLSFNLFNEPSGTDSAHYAVVAEKMIKAIRKEDPKRLIISDGVNSGSTPCLELLPFKVAQSTRGYAPHFISHYQAPWVEGSVEWQEPVWPKPILNAVISGADVGLDAPLVLRGGFEKGGKLTVKVKMSSDKAVLHVRADGKDLASPRYPTKPDQTWKVLDEKERRLVEARIPTGTKEVTLAGTEGFLVICDLAVQPEGQPKVVLPLSGEQWDMTQDPALLTPEGALAEDSPRYDSHWMWDKFMAPWREAEARGVGVMVGEFGCFNRTPHPVVMAWMGDWLANWKKAGWGWAMWNFRGSMGILDSGRKDIKYEDFEGHKLDKEMLTLLQKS